MLLPRQWFGRRAMIVSGAALTATPGTVRAEAASVPVGYLRWLEPRATISLLDKPPPDHGLAGAKLAISDNNTTGRFIGQQFELTDAQVRADDDTTAILAGLAERGVVLILCDLPADRLLQLAAAAHGSTLFNIAAPDDALR